MRDPDDPGIPRFVIFADYDDDGRLDEREPRTVSDRQGEYVLHDIRPPDSTYRLRESLLSRRSRLAPVALDWICSYPRDDTVGGTGGDDTVDGTGSAPNGRFPCASGPTDVGVSPNVTGLDFGNWFLARITLRKRVAPPGGLFDLRVIGLELFFELPSAGDGARETVSVPPGVYDISEMAAAGTNADDYVSSVECRRNPSRRGSLRPGTFWEDLEVFASDRATCTFRNIRPGSPAIGILKVGPALAEGRHARLHVRGDEPRRPSLPRLRGWW